MAADQPVTLEELFALHAAIQVQLMQVEKMIARQQGCEAKPIKGLSREQIEQISAQYYKKIFSKTK